MLRLRSGCPILLGYRTICFASVSRLSDSSRLSDNLLCERVPVVRFFSVIGQSTLRSRSACPILLGYRTTCFAIALCLSNSSRLSDNLSQELEWRLQNGYLSSYWLLFLYCPDSIVNKAKMWQYISIFRL